MKVWAISDLHVRFSENRTLLESVSAHPDDWLILGGDLGEGADDLHFVFRALAPKFARLLWVPGNHELWTIPGEAPELRGEAKYQHLVSLCHEYGVLTPEDPYPEWPNENRRVGAPAGPDNHASYTLSDAISDERARSASSPRRLVLAPLFLLYDYSFRPDDVTQARAVEWAADTGLACTDEALLNPDPHPNLIQSHLAFAHPTVFHLVRHQANGGLGRAFSSSRRGVWAPAHPPDPRGRRRPLRGSIAWVSTSVATGPPCGCVLAADLASPGAPHGLSRLIATFGLPADNRARRQCSRIYLIEARSL